MTLQIEKLLLFIGITVLVSRYELKVSADEKVIDQEWVFLMQKGKNVSASLGQLSHLGHHHGLNSSNKGRSRRKTAELIQWILLLSGDISLNPGPVKYPCKICKKGVRRNQKGICCDKCDNWLHTRCIGMDEVTYYHYAENDSTWYCDICSKDITNDSIEQEADTEDEDCYHQLKNDLNVKGLKIGHINVNGLFNKLHEIKYLLRATNFDVLAITETHLHKVITDDQLSIEGYKSARKDRENTENNWGGCMIYFKEELNGFEREDLNADSSIESAWIDLTISSQKILIGSVYRQPSDTNFFQNFQNFLEPICLRRTNILIVGDFNADLYFQQDVQKDMKHGKKLLGILKSFNLKNVIDQPTRISGTSKSMIDLVITTVTSKVRKHGVHNSGISDHHLVYAVLNLRRQISKPVIKEVRNYKNINHDAVKADFEQAPWHVCSIFEDINDAAWAWECLYKEIINRHVKVRKAKVRSNSLPWMNSAVRKQMNLRYKLLKKAQADPSKAENWVNYRKQRNYVTALCRTTEAQYWKTKFENAENSASFWKTVKAMNGKQKQKQIGPIKADNNQILTADIDMANCLNLYFSTVGEKLAEANSHTLQSDNASLRIDNMPELPDLSINKDKVKDTIRKKVKPGKSGGHDNVFSKDLSLFGDFAASGLSEIMNKCIERSQFPSQWKISKVCALFKKGSRMERENHRPISLLGIPSKVLESIICDNIDTYFTRSHLASPHQWAYKEGYSTELLLLHLTEVWKNEVHRGNVVGVLFIDFKKAFDSVCHKTLKGKLLAYGIKGKLYDILDDYLTERKQYVVVNGQSSNHNEVKYGVPQGSLLGPRLFAIQVNDLPNVPSKGSLEMFADDTEYYCVGKTVDEVMSLLQTGIREISEWCKNNSLTIHPGKSEIMIISNKRFIGPPPPVRLGDNIIKVVSDSKCLGVSIDCKLTWKSQVSKAASSMNKKVKQLRRFRSLQPDVLEKIYFQGILPSCTYGMAVWGSGPSLEPIETVHRRAAKLIHKLPKSTPVDKILEKANWKSIDYIYKRRVACLTHKINNNKCPRVLNDLVIKTKSQRATRNSCKLHLTRSKTNMGRNSFKHRAAIIWNRLSPLITSQKNYETFKRKLSQNSKILDNISFGQAATITYTDSNFIYF